MLDLAGALIIVLVGGQLDLLFYLLGLGQDAECTGGIVAIELIELFLCSFLLHLGFFVYLYVLRFVIVTRHCV